MHIEDKIRTEALRAWENGHCTDTQLIVAIEAITITLTTLRALECNWVMLMGLQSALNSMESALSSRQRAASKNV